MSWAAGLGADRSRLEQLLAPYDRVSALVVPDLMELLEGMAAGSGVDVVALRATNAFEELYAVLDPEATAAPVERCTDVLLAGTEGPLLVHQEQWYAADADSVAIVIDEPEGGIAVISPVVASGVPLVGMNATGTALGAMSLTAYDERAGVPRMFVARRALDACDPEEAWRTVTMPERAGGYTWCYAFAGGATAIFETTATTAADLRGVTAHANHALDGTVAAACPAPADGSRSRLARMQTLVATRDVWTVPQASALLGDHGADGQDICDHPDPARGDEASAIHFGMVCDVEAGIMWLAVGQPCSSEFHELRLDELLRA
jgi:hypothetical protein